MSAFTAREAAANAYRVAVGTPERPARGAAQWQDDSAELARERRAAAFRTAEARIKAAVGTQRIIYRDATDEQLEAMLAHAHAEIERLTNG